jgi:hypothetical protein
VAKWKVEVCAVLTPVWADIEVEADSEEEAKTEARDRAASLSSGDWETGDGSIEDIQVDQVSQV